MRRALRWLLTAAVALNAGSAPATVTLRVGAIPIGSNLPLYCAMEMGDLAAEGIELQVTNLSSGSRIIEALAGGSLDVGFSATLSILQAVEQGLDLVIIWPAAFVGSAPGATSGLMVRADSRISSASQLRGKVVGITPLKGVNYLMAVDYLARDGVGPEQVTWLEVPFPNMPAALEQRRVDAVWVTEPFVTVLRSSGNATMLTSAEQVVPGMALSAYVTLRPWYQRHGAAVAGLSRAFRRGLDACLRDLQRAREILAKRTGTSPDMAARLGLHTFRPALAPGDLAQLQEIARRHGLLGRALAIERILAPEAQGR